jgi:hypothetical protein
MKALMILIGRILDCESIKAERHEIRLVCRKL